MTGLLKQFFPHITTTLPVPRLGVGSDDFADLSGGQVEKGLCLEVYDGSK